LNHGDIPALENGYHPHVATVLGTNTVVKSSQWCLGHSYRKKFGWL